MPSPLPASPVARPRRKRSQAPPPRRRSRSIQLSSPSRFPPLGVPGIDAPGYVRFAAAPVPGTRLYTAFARFTQVRWPAMRYCVQSDEETVLFGAERGCAAFEQRLLRFDGPSASRSEPDDDEVIYVLRGAGRASIAGRPTELTP